MPPYRSTKVDTDKLLTIIKQLADELEDEIKDRYCDMRGDIHPAMKRHFDRDMTTVNEARTVLGRGYKATNPAIF